MYVELWQTGGMLVTALISVIIAVRYARANNRLRGRVELYADQLRFAKRRYEEEHLEAVIQKDRAAMWRRKAVLGDSDGEIEKPDDLPVLRKKDDRIASIW